MRRPILAANWKMHKTAAEAEAFAKAFLPRVATRGANEIEIVLAAPFTALPALGRALAGSCVALAAQNLHPEPHGAFTGEVSAVMLRELGCRYVIVGHSERRQIFGETDEFIARKVETALASTLLPILCVGETASERDAGRTFEVLAKQLAESVARVPKARAAELVLAYEPVWAIGTGQTATPEIAQEAHAFLRQECEKHFGSAAKNLRIQYGGSVKPDNAAALMAKPDIDGALVGGASLDPESFAKIVNFRCA